MAATATAPIYTPSSARTGRKAEQEARQDRNAGVRRGADLSV